MQTNCCLQGDRSWKKICKKNPLRARMYVLTNVSLQKLLATNLSLQWDALTEATRRKQFDKREIFSLVHLDE